MIKERTTADIAIKRGNTVIQSVPITERSVRKFTLMQEDSITLAFNLADPVEFKIGDYINDEIFGKFVITQKQMPTYSDGAYKYNLKFEASYLRWRNFKFMLTEEKNSVRYRKEAVWSLTSDLETHVDEVLHNLSVLGATYTKTISAEKASEVRFIDYDAVDIITALNQMAEAYECEWWVKNDTIYFGKCEENNDPFTFTLGGTFNGVYKKPSVESMEIQNDQQTYANRIYPFGSERNVPDTYDRDLLFTVTNSTSITIDSNSVYVFKDMYHEMLPAYLTASGSNLNKTAGLSPPPTPSESVVVSSETKYRKYEWGGSATEIDLASDYDIVGMLTVSGNVRFVNPDYDSDKTFKIKITLELGGIELYSSTSDTTQYWQIEREDGVDVYTYSYAVNVDTTKSLSTTSYTPKLTVETTNNEVDGGGCFIDAPTITASPSLSDFINITYGGTSKTCGLLFLGNEYRVRLNPAYQSAGGQYYNYFAFINDQGEYIAKPTNFGETVEGHPEYKEYHLTGLSVKVPLSYWTRIDSDDPSATAKLGEKRLHLNNNQAVDNTYVKGNGYIELPSLDPSEVVEQVVAFDEIYPKCTLKITAVDESQKREKSENRDGSTYWWDWVQYSFNVAQINGDPFPFDDDYILDGNTLQCKFLTLEEAQEEVSGYNAGTHYLSGMTFDLAFTKNGAYNYTIVRNEDYGAKLPNETLRPNVGDVLVLLGWNVNAMADLGLVANAETALETKAVEYLKAINDDQFTFTCKLMSNELFDLVEKLPFDVQPSDEEQTEVEDFYDDNNARFYVRNGNYAYNLFLEGTKVTIMHHALKDGTKTSRIIGYEFKLDKPYDTPTYVVGETEAFSRLKKLEKEITKLGG